MGSSFNIRIANILNFAAVTSIALAAVFSPQANAAEAGQFELSASAGQVGLLNDPGRDGANAIGFAIGLGYLLQDNFSLEMQYLGSNHSEVRHRELSVGGNYYFGDYENSYPHVSLGMSFLSNHFKDANTTGDAVGLYLGGGLAFELSRNLTIGPEIRYQKAFEAKGQVNGPEIVTVGDSYTVLLRLSYAFGVGD